MKRFFKIDNAVRVLFILCISMFLGCTNEPDYKVIRQEVVDLHNKVMEDGEMASKYRLMLDTLSRTGLKGIRITQPGIDTTAEQKNIAILNTKLNQVDQDMMKWMQDFVPDIEGKRNAEAVKYFEGERIKIKKLDSQYNQILNESHAYLKKFNLITPSNQTDHHHDKN
ncbi:hypothetical protein [Pedobacter sp. GR22-10]|uniref:hypothetical protein n=1 Tax=Pedobacter sp. GR22-10 TaxID=2994472 RepID=UPI0022474CDA|nr:hypothetical protein [Pedobacter sp. GR22-10]MCX2429972.1 hypothetical protein [Pedobacter sp. GR22-10]